MMDAIPSVWQFDIALKTQPRKPTVSWGGKRNVICLTSFSHSSFFKVEGSYWHTSGLAHMLTPLGPSKKMNLPVLRFLLLNERQLIIFTQRRKSEHPMSLANRQRVPNRAPRPPERVTITLCRLYAQNRGETMLVSKKTTTAPPKICFLTQKQGKR
jgi:hypothetical protein